LEVSVGRIKKLRLVEVDCIVGDELRGVAGWVRSLTTLIDIANP
jgi:hypothetical protein